LPSLHIFVEATITTYQLKDVDCISFIFRSLLAMFSVGVHIVKGVQLVKRGTSSKRGATSKQ